MGGRRNNNKSVEKGIEPLVSIVTASLNSSKTIEKCIRSVIDQSYPYIEHIIIDGMSEDGTVEILKDYDDVIEYWRSEKDSGLYDALNKGLRLIRGDLVLILGSDDFLHKSGIDALVSEWKTSKPDIVYGDASIINRDSTLKYIFKGAPNFKMVPYRMPASHQAMLFTKSIYLKAGLFDTEYRIAADVEHICRCIIRFKARGLYVPATVAYFTDGGTGSGMKDHFRSKKEARTIILKYGGNALRAWCMYYRQSWLPFIIFLIIKKIPPLKLLITKVRPNLCSLTWLKVSS